MSMTPTKEETAEVRTERTPSSENKRTEIGFIPKDWDLKTIQEIGRVKGGKRLPPGFTLTDAPTPHPYIRVLDMRPGGVSLDDIRFVPPQAFPAIKNYRIFCDEIFISVAGTLGIVGVIPPELHGANLTENADKIAELQCDRDYLLHWLNSNAIQRIIDSIKTVGAQPKLALGRIANFPIAIPRQLHEQRAIAAALSEVGQLIGALDKLITKKHAIKLATTQQLITGTTRLPGFDSSHLRKETIIGPIPQEWTVEPCEELCSKIQDGTHFSPKLGGNEYLYITSKNVGFGALDLSDIERIDEAAHRKIYTRCDAKKGDVLLTKDGANTGNAAINHLEEECSLLSSVAFLRFDPTFHDPRFHLQYILSHKGQARIKDLMSGNAITRLTLEKIRRFLLPVPPLREQVAIASVLSDMDAEITALERRREKTKAIKQGMMQALLTGRVRLVKPELST
jgi:type I restriction enzyme S subunit